MNTYKVYMLGEFRKAFTTRDNAIAYILGQGESVDNFEILDGSDN
jgi:hypothetical protein